MKKNINMVARTSRPHRIFIVTAIASVATMMTGCVTETAKVTEYDQQGRILKVTETSRHDAVSKIMAEMEKRNSEVLQQLAARFERRDDVADDAEYGLWHGEGAE